MNAIPSSQHTTLITEAMQSAFADELWQIEEPLGGGLSSSTLYKISLGAKTIVARLSDPAGAGADLASEYGAMQMAGQAGLAPAVYYADAQKGIVLMAYIAAEPLFGIGLGSPEQVEKLAGFVRALHDGDVFPGREPIYHKTHQIITLLQPAWRDHPLVQQALQLRDTLIPQLNDPTDLRSSHTDINPNNLLYANNQFWLVDWEGASQQSLYFDLASCGNFFYYSSPALETAFLTAYFQRPPTPSESEKYRLMRQFVAIFYGLIFLYISGLMGASLLSADELDTLPTYPDMMNRVGSGQESLGMAHTQHKLGFIYLQTALTNSKAD